MDLPNVASLGQTVVYCEVNNQGKVVKATECDGVYALSGDERAVYAKHLQLQVNTIGAATIKIGPVTELKSWMRENATLIYFLIAQAIAIGAAVLSITAYMVRLETRVSTLETRGSPHLSTIDNRLTVLESLTRDNKEALDRIIAIMTRELGKRP